MNKQPLCQPCMCTEHGLSNVISLCFHRWNEAIMYGWDHCGSHGSPLHIPAILARYVWRNYLVHLWFSHFKNVPVKFLVSDLLLSISGITVQASRAVCFPVLFLLGLLQLLAVQLRREFLPFAQNKPVPTKDKVVGFDGQPCSGSYHLSYG